MDSFGIFWCIHALLWQWNKPINPTDSNTTLNLSVRLILHWQSKCQTNISLSNATFLTSPSLTKYHSSISSHVPSICYNCNALRPLQWSSGPTLLWASWPTRSSNLIDYHLVKLGHFCRALAGQKYSLMSVSKNMTECTKHGRKKTWKGILDYLVRPHICHFLSTEIFSTQI